jgi:hypothetical protein
VNRVVPDAQLFEAAFELARRIAAGPPIALRWMKEHLNRALDAELAEILALCRLRPSPRLRTGGPCARFSRISGFLRASCSRCPAVRPGHRPICSPISPLDPGARALRGPPAIGFDDRRVPHPSRLPLNLRDPAEAT